MDNANLICRGKKIYLQVMYKGERFLRSTGFEHDDKSGWKNARIWRDKKLLELRDGRINEFQADKIRTDMPTLGEFADMLRVAAAIKRAQDRKPSEATVEQYIGSLLGVVWYATKTDPNEVRLDVLTKELAQKYRKAVVTAEDPELELRQRRTAASTLRQARSCFSETFLAEYRKQIRIPDELKGFVAEAKHPAEKRKYEMPPEELINHTHAEAAKLEGDMRMVYLLSYYLGMRASEIVMARPEWIDERQLDGDVKRKMQIKERSDPEPYKPKGINHELPIGSRVHATIMALKQSDTPYFLQGSKNQRKQFIARKFSAFMRNCGWNPEKYSKGAHELRKLAGAEWYTKYGVHVAARWLGHSDIQTTYDFYSSLASHPDAIDMPEER